MAASGSTSMKKTLTTLATLGCGMVLLSFVVVVINQTAGVVQLAKEVSPTLGTATLWGLLIAYGGLISVPIVIVMRMPRPLVAPTTDAGPEFDDHLKRLGERLAINPRVQLAAIRPIDRRGIDEALRLLDDEANVIVKQMASTVFLTTAVSQSGRLDALLVLAAQSRMVWRMRASLLPETVALPARWFISMRMWPPRRSSPASLDDLELHQMIQPVVAGTAWGRGEADPWFHGHDFNHGQFALER